MAFRSIVIHMTSCMKYLTSKHSHLCIQYYTYNKYSMDQHEMCLSMTNRVLGPSSICFLFLTY